MKKIKIYYPLKTKQKVIRGKLYWPVLPIEQGKPTDPEIIRTKVKRSLSEMHEILKKVGRIGVRGHYRGVDGGGSSLDLPLFQEKLTYRDSTMENMPSTVTIASELSGTIWIEKADRDDIIEYIAPDYGLPEGKHDIIYKDKGIEFDSLGRLKRGQRDGAAYIFSLFGIWGVRIYFDKVHPLALAGGMESSNVANTAFLALAVALSGADISQADIFSLAVKLENFEFLGNTGGQGQLCCLNGGVYQNIWLSGVIDDSNNRPNPYAAFTVPLLTEDRYKEIEDHLMLVQAGIEYKDGKKVINRTAALNNFMWTDLLLSKDEVGYPLHQEKLELTNRYSKGISDGNYKEVVEVLNRYVDIRDNLCTRWCSLVLDAKEGKKVPEYANDFAAKVFDEKNADYKLYSVVREMIDQGVDLRKVSLYDYGLLIDLINNGRKNKIAIFPAGAGGPGAIAFAVSEEGVQSMKKFFEANGYNKVDEVEANKIINGSGILKGYMEFKVGRDPLTFITKDNKKLTKSELENMGLKYPEPALNGYIDENSGIFYEE